MKATEILMAEHRVIERVIAAIEAGANRVEGGGDIKPAFFLDAAEFITGFADGCHHKKEEGVLFRAITESGVAEKGGPVGVMLAEHEQGRQFTRGMRAAAERLSAGDLAAREALVANARGYAALLRQHILKEDHILFPLADRVIPPEQYEAVAEGFEHVEHEETGEGVHEKYLALAEKLEFQAGLTGPVR